MKRLKFYAGVSFHKAAKKSSKFCKWDRMKEQREALRELKGVGRSSSPSRPRRWAGASRPRGSRGCRMGAGWPRSSPPLCLLMHLGAPSAWGTATLTAWETLSYCEMCRAALGINHSSWVWGPTSLFAHFMWWNAWIIQKEPFIPYWLSRSRVGEVPLHGEVSRVRCYCIEKLAENLILTFLSIWGDWIIAV